jgi:phosphohistidine phosphatase
MRHAKSTYLNVRDNDFARALDSSGEVDADNMAKHLKRQDFSPDNIISSPANRALSTANIVCNHLSYPTSKIVKDGSIYEATLGALQSIIENQDQQFEHIMLIGHNPGLESLCHYIEIDCINTLTPCNVVQFELNIDLWKGFDFGCGTCISYKTPKNIQ